MRWQPAGWLAAPALGLVFALSWTPCITPMLTTIALLGSGGGSFPLAVVASIAYALGLSAPFFALVLGAGAIGRATKLARRYGALLHWSTVAVLVMIGVLMASGLWTDLARSTVELASVG